MKDRKEKVSDFATGFPGPGPVGHCGRINATETTFRSIPLHSSREAFKGPDRPPIDRTGRCPPRRALPRPARSRVWPGPPKTNSTMSWPPFCRGREDRGGWPKNIVGTAPWCSKTCPRATTLGARSGQGWPQQGRQETLAPDRPGTSVRLRRMCPVAIEVFCGNTADPATLASQIRKLRERFGLARVVLVTDRGILIQVQIDQVRDIEGFDWITALRSPSIARLRDRGVFQASLFETKNLAGITSPDSPGERLVCRSPVRAGSGFRPSAGFRRSVLSGGQGIRGSTWTQTASDTCQDGMRVLISFGLG